MNLCLACRDIRRDADSGLVRATCDLARALAEAGDTVHLLTSSSGPLPQLTGVSIEQLELAPVGGPFAQAAPESPPHNLMHAAAVYREVLRIGAEEQPVDAVLAPLWRSEGVVCMLDDRFPTIVSCMTSLRTLTEIDGRYQLLGDLPERLALERAALGRSRYLHGLTQAVLDKTIRDYDLRPDATAVINRGLRDRRGASSSDGAASGVASEARESEAAEILFVGRIEPRKGVDTLLAAARELAAAGDSVQVTLAGPEADPDIRASFEHLANEQPRLREAVRFTGAVSDRELDRLYRAADVVCVPSRYESHGVVSIEAMMFGKPIVTCDAGGITEVVTPENALVSPPEDAAALTRSLRRLIGDPQLRAQLGAAGREAYERRFEASAVAARTRSFVRDVISMHGRTAPATADVRRRLAALVQETFAVSEADAAAFTSDLLESPQRAPTRFAGLRRLAARVRAAPKRG
jgi:glycogen synthase